MADPSAAFHELYLFFIDSKDSAVAVRFAIESDYKAVAERCYLIFIANTGHRASLGHEITELVKKSEQLFVAHRIRVVAFDACEFFSDAMMHVGRSFLVDVAE